LNRWQEHRDLFLSASALPMRSVPQKLESLRLPHFAQRASATLSLTAMLHGGGRILEAKPRRSDLMPSLLPPQPTPHSPCAFELSFRYPGQLEEAWDTGKGLLTIQTAKLPNSQRAPKPRPREHYKKPATLVPGSLASGAALAEFAVCALIASS